MTLSNDEHGCYGADAHGAQELLQVLLPTKPGVHAKDSRNKRIAGYCCVVLLVFCWVAQSEVAQAVEDHNFNQPFVITYFNHSLSILLAPTQAFLLWLQRRSTSRKTLEDHRTPVTKLAKSPSFLIQVAAVSVIYQLADWAWYVGLAGTSVADGTIIFSTIAVFVFVLERLQGRRSLTLRRGLAVLLAFVGVILVEHSPGENNAADVAAASASASDAAAAAAPGALSSVEAGNLLVLLAAFLYAIYQLKVDELLPEADTADTNFFLALQGVVTLCCFWPGILGSPLPDWESLKGTLVSGLLALSFNVLFCLATLLTSPLTTSVGCMLAAPASILTDWLLHDDPITCSALLGSTLVLFGFVLLNV